LSIGRFDLTPIGAAFTAVGGAFAPFLGDETAAKSGETCFHAASFPPLRRHHLLRGRALLVLHRRTLVVALIVTTLGVSRPVAVAAPLGWSVRALSVTGGDADKSAGAPEFGRGAKRAWLAWHARSAKSRVDGDDMRSGRYEKMGTYA